MCMELTRHTATLTKNSMHIVFIHMNYGSFAMKQGHFVALHEMRHISIRNRCAYKANS